MTLRFTKELTYDLHLLSVNSPISFMFFIDLVHDHQQSLFHLAGVHIVILLLGNMTFDTLIDFSFR